MSFNGCPGEAVETDTCNEGPCPTWSDWSSWDECSEKCDGGIQSRTRQCQNGEEGDCAGSATDEQQCNRQSCEREMVYWDNRISGTASNSWTQIGEQYLPSGETIMERCVAYCLSFSGCFSVAVTRLEYLTTDRPVTYQCYINSEDFTYTVDTWGQQNSAISHTIQFGVFRDYYEENPQFLPWTIDGVIGANYAEVEGLCDDTNTGFGTVNYRETDGIQFNSNDDKNIVRESGSDNCAARCFEKAGCSAFFVEDGGCTFVIGSTFGGEENSGVSESGMLHGLCPSSAFRSTFTRRSQFYCYIWAPNEGARLADSIVRRNTGNSNTPLRVWSFETRSNNPMITASQYVSVDMTDLEGTDRRYRPIIFAIETHVRIGENQTSRKRRTADAVPVDVITVKEDVKLHKQAAKEAKQAAKQRSIMLRTDDILAEIEAIEQQATSFILDGGMDMPDDVEVAATGPVETVEFVQTAADGSVAADCSSGSCECSAGFVDNGNGCEEMTEEQAATTPAPVTTQAVSSDSVRDWLTSLINKIESVLEDNRPEKPRTHILKKWRKLGYQFVRRFETISDKGCDLADTFEDNTIDFNSVNTCNVSSQFK